MSKHTLSMTCLALVALITLLANQVKGDSVLNWFWKSEEAGTPVLVSDGVPLIDIPYEQLTEDEKFLKEAAKFITDIQVSSPLEVCQHKVVLKIKTSCSSMTEEQLAKLSVNLLNCQSETEGRRTYPCTDDMTIKQCTSQMDADTWNAYHLMSNRARAVCYAARSHQFRALTELTVNKLMQSARSQIEKLAHLKESQDRLEEQTIAAQQIVESNIRDLTEEKALIRSGHAQLASMTENIKEKLENASKEIFEQATERSINHLEILEDLEKIQTQAQDLWDKIESSTTRIITQNYEAALKYEETLQKLEKINETILYVWDITNNMRTEIDKKLGWITEYIGTTGENLEKVYRTGLHVIYLLAAMIIAAFLQAPFLTRSAILGVVPLNLLSYLKHGYSASLDFISLTVLIALITAMHYLMNGIQYMIRSRKQNDKNHENVQLNSHVEYNSEPQEQNLSLLSKIYCRILNFQNIITYQAHKTLENLSAAYVTLKSWVWKKFMSSEELSCSYLPARKYENIANKTFASISEDESEYSDSPDYRYLVHNNNSTSGAVLRRHYASPLTDIIKENMEPRIRETIRAPRSREISPSSVVTPLTRIPCAARTRSGNPCRLMPQRGQNFCHRHTSGSSYTGD